MPTDTKIIVEYQATDENGQPIGTPTHLEADNWEEMSKKQREAHVQVTRAYHRLKDAKPTQNAPEALRPRELTADEEFQTTLELQDPSKARKAFRKLLEAELPLEQMQKDGQSLRETNALQQRLTACAQFIAAHPDDFFNCDANGRILGDYLAANNLAWTKDNLEIAFAMKVTELAAKPVPPPAAPAVELNTPARRPSATPDIQPGSLNGQPRGVRQPGLTKADYLKMAKENPEEWKRHMGNTTLRAKLDRVLSA